jgi:putative oxidoreductase
MRWLFKLHDLLDWTRRAGWLAPLALRLYLAPVFWMAGMQKFNHFADTVEWFGNAEWGVGLPLPASWVVRYACCLASPCAMSRCR